MKSQNEVKAGGARQTVVSPENRNGEALVLHRQSHHGWGEGANVGAVVGILFPPTIVGAAIVGAGGGALVARRDGGADRQPGRPKGRQLSRRKRLPSTASWPSSRGPRR